MIKSILKFISLGEFVAAIASNWSYGATRDVLIQAAIEREYKNITTGTWDLHVKVVLINRSTDTLYYYDKQCSREDYYRSDNEDFYLHYKECEYEETVIKSLLPMQSDFIVLHVTSRQRRTRWSSFRIGFSLEKPWANADMKEKNPKLIWSNKIVWRKE